MALLGIVDLLSCGTSCHSIWVSHSCLKLDLDLVQILDEEGHAWVNFRQSLYDLLVFSMQVCLSGRNGEMNIQSSRISWVLDAKLVPDLQVLVLGLVRENDSEEDGALPLAFIPSSRLCEQLLALLGCFRLLGFQIIIVLRRIFITRLVLLGRFVLKISIVVLCCSCCLEPLVLLVALGLV